MDGGTFPLPPLTTSPSNHRAYVLEPRMQGAQYYLSEDIQITNGHIGFLQNPWALAAVSQTQFRPHLNLSNMGDGSVKGVLSVTISNWTTPGL